MRDPFFRSVYIFVCPLELGRGLRSPGGAFESDVYESVRSGECPVGIIPQENSIHGIVIETYDILKAPDIGRKVFVRGEVTIGIQHCLITRKGVALKDVRRVLSHEQVRILCVCEAIETDLGTRFASSVLTPCDSIFSSAKLYVFWAVLLVSRIPLYAFITVLDYNVLVTSGIHLRSTDLSNAGYALLAVLSILLLGARTV